MVLGVNIDMLWCASAVSRDGVSSMLQPTKKKHENVDQTLCEGFSPAKPWRDLPGDAWPSISSSPLKTDCLLSKEGLCSPALRQKILLLLLVLLATAWSTLMIMS